MRIQIVTVPTQPGQNIIWSNTFSNKSDLQTFHLLLLDETPPASYKPYFAGWNAQA